jgi:hypothetical protein
MDAGVHLGLPYRFYRKCFTGITVSLEKRFPFYTIKVSARRLGLKTRTYRWWPFLLSPFFTINTKSPITADYRRTGECFDSLCHEGGGCLTRNAGSEKDHKIPILNQSRGG